ncbi:MAG: molybdopterin-guanine dinucleotide biosynthesis protein A [Pseudonocardiales bacterium]|nr:MAG: molybdopterin-guanine dinucleotide biosynthesis protein A [Pseudonocardiales bacterium]
MPAGLLLAAGGGRRYGRPKALVQLDGTLLVDRAMRVLADGGCAPLFVVLGAAADEVVARADLPAATVVRNADWESGMASSLRAGLTALQDTGATAALILLVDTPGIGAAAARRVAQTTAPDALAVATYAGRQGHPVLLGREHWAEVIRTTRGDAGAREFLATHADLVRQIPCDDVADDDDVDVPGDLPS